MSIEVEYTPVLPRGHAVKFYADEAELADTVRRHIVPAAQRGAAAVVIATAEHRRVFEAELTAAGIDPAAAVRDGTLLLLDAVTTMDQFISDSGIDAERFRRVVGGAIERASRSGRPVIAFGEMVAVLWEAGNLVTAIALEELWNELAEELEFGLLCGYPASTVADDDHAEALAELCRLHSAVLDAPAEPPMVLEAVRNFARDREAPAQARRFVAEVLEVWGHDGAFIEDAKLVVSELTTNAVVHAGSAFRLVVRRRTSEMWLEVHDSSHAFSELRAGAPAADSGHGLNLVAAVAHDWGVDQARTGKVVWAQLRV